MSKVDRECGECEVCCVVLKVPDIGKAAKVPCHLLNRTGPGCSLHGSKLQASICREWQCLLKQGTTSIEARPDRVGIVTYLSADRSLCIHEFRPGSFESRPHLKEEVLKISDHTGIKAQILHSNGDKTLVVPKKNKDMYGQLNKIVTVCEKASNESK